jgi:tetratricopeptide (TPR) repeat protein
MNIDEEIKNVNTNDYNQVINFYESHKLYFDNYQRLEDSDRIGKFIDIKLVYCNSLTHKQHLDKILKTLREVDELLIKLPIDYWSYKESERQSRFLKAIALSGQKKFKEAYPLLKKLITEDPDHHHYKVWFDHTKLGFYNWIFNLMSFIGIGCIVSYITLSELGFQLPFDLGIVGILILGISFLTQIGLKEYIKRRK